MESPSDILARQALEIQLLKQQIEKQDLERKIKDAESKSKSKAPKAPKVSEESINTFINLLKVHFHVDNEVLLTELKTHLIKNRFRLESSTEPRGQVFKIYALPHQNFWIDICIGIPKPAYEPKKICVIGAQQSNSYGFAYKEEMFLNGSTAYAHNTDTARTMINALKTNGLLSLDFILNHFIKMRSTLSKEFHESQKLLQSSKNSSNSSQSDTPSSEDQDK
jgi:hypothetical protein